MIRTTQLLVPAALLSLSMGCGSADKSTVTPEYTGNVAPVSGVEPSDANDLSRADLTNGSPKPHFDEDGYYEMVEVVRFTVPPVPPTAGTVATTEPADLDVSVMIEPTLADACGLPKPGVKFKTDSAEVKDSKQPALAALAACLQIQPLDDDRLVITGYADPRGSEYYNRELGMDRANAVGEALVARGLAKARFDTYSRGESLASEDPEDWAGNRRVSIRLDK